MTGSHWISLDVNMIPKHIEGEDPKTKSVMIWRLHFKLNWMILISGIISCLFVVIVLKVVWVSIRFLLETREELCQFTSSYFFFRLSSIQLFTGALWVYFEYKSRPSGFGSNKIGKSNFHVFFASWWLNVLFFLLQTAQHVRHKYRNNCGLLQASLWACPSDESGTKVSDNEMNGLHRQVVEVSISVFNCLARVV
jgi:hypothetical protein